MTNPAEPPKCRGWPVGTPCDKKPGTPWGPYWCPECSTKRLAHLDAQFNKLARGKP